MIRWFRFRNRCFALSLLVCIARASALTAGFDEDPVKNPTPATGEKARDFTLRSLERQDISLKSLTNKGPVVLLVLRGYPGYQCPICSRQVGDFLKHSEGFAAKKATVVLIYPGPSDKLQEHAEEFVVGKTVPKGFQLLIDPDYTFTNAYGLRWDAPHETAYPSTFVISKDNEVLFSRVSKTHGGRTSAEEVIKALPALDSTDHR